MFGFSIIKTKDYEQLRKRAIDAEQRVDRLQRKCWSLEADKERFEHELDEIKPILDSKKYKSAFSEDCIRCEYAMTSAYGRLIGCRKDAVCEDFKKREV